MKKGVTQVEIKVSNELEQIYSTMMKFGYPGLLSSEVFQSSSQIQKYLSDFFQPTPKREHLIQWLILTINPLYSQQTQTKVNKKRILLNNLWKLGVMPFSKYTNNLDYEKYVQGLLGYENSVNLIYNLCVLLKASFQFDKSKEDQTFASFLDELIKNYDSLVNLDYDPYKISFPAAYQDLPEQEFEQQYQEMAQHIKKSQESQGEQSHYQHQYQDIFSQFEQNKTKFQQIYNILVGRMKEVINSRTEMIQNWKKPDELKGRTLKISPNLTKKYREYKQKIKIPKMSHSQLAEEKQNLKILIESLNDTVCL